MLQPFNTKFDQALSCNRPLEKIEAKFRVKEDEFEKGGGYKQTYFGVAFVPICFVTSHISLQEQFRHVCLLLKHCRWGKLAGFERFVTQQ